LLWILNNMFFQYYSLAIFLISLAVMFAVSYATAEPSYERISGLTFGTTSAEHKAESRKSWNQWDVVSSLVVIALIIAAYIYFS